MRCNRCVIPRCFNPQNMVEGERDRRYLSLLHGEDPSAASPSACQAELFIVHLGYQPTLRIAHPKARALVITARGERGRVAAGRARHGEDWDAGM